MNPMNFLLGVMGSGSLTFVGLSAYAVVEARRMPGQPPHTETVKPVEAPIEAIAAPAPAMQVVAESVPIVAEVPILAPTTPTLELGYWPIRGLAGPLRMILAYSGVEYEDRQHDADSWFGQTKPELLKSNPMANLPYIKEKEGDSCVVQSNACLLYLGSKLGLDPTSNLDPRAITNLQVLNESTDLRLSLAFLSYPWLKIARTQEEFDATRTEQLTQKVPQVYTKLEAHLGQRNTAFFSADTPLSADFHVWEALDLHEALARSAGAESPLAQYPKLQTFYTTFRELPQLEKYFASDAYQLPITIARMNPWVQ
eukprot:GGOE01025180.1.p1 GENE.GGOE01025180.1~~GGOE01025180.1.p1  ORF type:complete len:329 (-),score=107.72 GGOE01025180.1:409-1344(-)